LKNFLLNDLKTLSIKELISYGEKKLNNNNIDESKLKTRWLLSYILKIPLKELTLNYHCILDLKQIKKFSNFIERSLAYEPIQYIIKETEFYGLDFKLNKNVLIPRPETERIVECAIDEIKKFNFKMILDIGTGSGIIAICIAKLLNNDMSLIGIDTNKKALKIAKKNALKLGVSSKIKFIYLDILKNKLKSKFDIIVSNPPYVSLNDYKNLDKEIKLFEPKNALTDNNNGMKFYERYANEGYKWLNKNGIIILEVGRKNHYEKVKKIFLEKKWKNVELINDLNGDPRILKANI